MDARITELHKAAAERGDVIGLCGGLPADELMPREALARALAEVTASRDDALQYGWPEGAEQVRCWVANRLAARGASVDPDRVIVTAGAQQALAIAGAALRERTIAVGDATYPAALEAFRRAGAVPVARDGEVRYAITGVSNPAGRAVDHRDLLDAPAPQVPIIADEAYAELRFDGVIPRPLVADAPARVWHVGTVSKTIAPGLRVGWLVPPPEHHQLALDLKAAADLHTASITQAALGRLLASLDYEALLTRARATYAARADALATALAREVAGIRFAEPEGGFSIWVETDDRGDELRLLEAALAEGVMVDPGSLFRVEPDATLGFRLSFSSSAPDRLAEGAHRLGRALRRWRRA